MRIVRRISRSRGRISAKLGRLGASLSLQHAERGQIRPRQQQRHHSKPPS